MTPRSTVLASVSTAGLLLLAGCGGGGVRSEEPDTGGTPAPAYTSSLDIEMDSTPSAAPSEAPVEVVYPEGTKGTGEFEDDGYGQYERVTYDPASGMLNYDDVVDDAAEQYFSTQQIATAVSTANAWLIEEGLDSIIADAQRKDEWLEAVAPRLTASAQETVSQADNLEGIVTNDLSDERAFNGAPYYLVPVAGTRVHNVDIDVKEVYVVESENDGPVPDSALVVSYAGSAGRYFRNEVPELREYTAVEALTLDMKYLLVQADSGEWLIDGWETNWEGGTCAELVDPETGEDIETPGELPEQYQCEVDDSAE